MTATVTDNAARSTHRRHSAEFARVVAVHESAHAVAAVAYGFTLDSVSIVPNGRHDGICWWSKLARRDIAPWLDTYGANLCDRGREVVVLAAGPAAEWLKFQGVDNWQRGGSDYDPASRIVAEHSLAPGNVDGYLLLRHCQALRLMMRDNVKLATRMVAAPLLDRETLTGDEATRIIQRQL